jgi:septal ring factor EnvC (AmiA/AmiB activator)
VCTGTEQRVRTLSDQIRVLNDQHTRQINANARELQALGIQIQTLESRLNELEDHLRVRRESVVVIIAPNLLFTQLRTPPLMREHISDDGLRSLVDMDMLHSDKLVTAMT